MRSTRATAAVERLKERSGNEHYAMVRNSDESFHLVDNSSGSGPQIVSDRLPLDDFVAFVQTLSPAKPRRQTKSDVAFEKQLVKR